MTSHISSVQVSHKLSHRISKASAETDISVAKFLLDNFSGEELEKQRRKYNKFEDAWNELQQANFLEGEMLDGGCQAVLVEGSGTMPVMSDEQCIALSCIGHSSRGQIVYAAVQKLANLQNSYMEAALQLASQSDCRGALRFYEATQSGQGTDPGQSMCDTKDVQLILEKELVRYEWEDYFFQLGECDFEYGKGKQTDYNWTELEMELAMNFLFEW